MNKLTTTFSIIILTLIFAPLLNSCLDDGTPYPQIGIGTIIMFSEREYFILLDDGDKMFPGDDSSLTNYKLEDGKRVIVQFYFLDEKISGYKYNVEIVHIENILTKEAVRLTEENAEEIGNDAINITAAWFAGDCLNLRFQIMGSQYPTEKHLLNLVYNEIPGANEGIDEEGYLTMELRHNAYNDQPVESLPGIVAFKEPFTTDTSIKGLKLVYKSIYEGTKYHKINFVTTDN